MRLIPTAAAVASTAFFMIFPFHFARLANAPFDLNKAVAPE